MASCICLNSLAQVSSSASAIYNIKQDMVGFNLSKLGTNLISVSFKLFDECFCNIHKNCVSTDISNIDISDILQNYSLTIRVSDSRKRVITTFEAHTDLVNNQYYFELTNDLDLANLGLDVYYGEMYLTQKFSDTNINVYKINLSESTHDTFLLNIYD